jgi:hypothetical protein
VVLDLGTGEEPAETVPEWTLMSPKGDGLLRVTLPSVSATGVSDGRFGDDLLKSFYVVRAPEGGMFVDVFARRAFTYRVLELSDPAQLVVDFKPSGEPLEVPLPRAGGNTVLVEPRAGAWIDPPLTVSGYSRNFEASNTVVLVDSRGKSWPGRSSRATIGARPGDTSRRPWIYHPSAEEEPCGSGPKAPGTGPSRASRYRSTVANQPISRSRAEAEVPTSRSLRRSARRWTVFQFSGRPEHGVFPTVASSRAEDGFEQAASGA